MEKCAKMCQYTFWQKSSQSYEVLNLSWGTLFFAKELIKSLLLGLFIIISTQKKKLLTGDFNFFYF